MPKYRLGYSTEEVGEKVKKGEWQMHEYPLGFVLTEIRVFKEEKVCFVHFLGGRSFDSWKSKVNEDLREFAKAKGCSSLEASCRLGLGKKLESLGWKRWHIVMKKDLR